MSEKLRQVLSKAWAERHHGYSSALREFTDHAAADAKFLAAAKKEHSRLDEMSTKRTLGCELAQRCAVSAETLKFLTQAMSTMTTTPLPTVSPIPSPQSPKQEDEMTSKLKALAGLAKSTVAKVEADAEAAVNRLQAAEAKAHAGVGKINSVAGDIEQSAGQLEDFANQISNGGPPLEQ